MAAEDVYNRTLANVPIRFVTPDRKIDYQYPKVDTIEIANFDTIKSVLIHFGRLITKLELDARQGKLDKKRTEEQTKFISNLINLHCSETLKELTLLIVIDGFDVFDNFVKPFDKIEYLLLWGDFQTLGNKYLGLNELFPAMNNLVLRAKITDSKGIDTHFPNLRHISVTNFPKGKNERYLDDDDIKRFISKNQQIQNITLTCESTELLWFISENMPQLNELFISFFTGDPEDQRDYAFENVRSLTIEHFRGRLPNGFRKLEVFKMLYSSDSWRSWKDLLRNNTNLRHLDTYQSLSFGENELDELTQLIPNVETLRIPIHAELSDDSIINFIKANEKLKKVHFNRVRVFSETAARLQQEIGHEWHIFVDDRYRMYLDRRDEVSNELN